MSHTAHVSTIILLLPYYVEDGSGILKTRTKFQYIWVKMYSSQRYLCCIYFFVSLDWLSRSPATFLLCTIYIRYN